MDFPFAAGALLALSVVASVGPVSLKCLYSGLVHGRRAAILAGLGGGTTHGIFAALAGTGAGAVGTIIADHDGIVRLVSAAILLSLGLRVLLKRAPAAAPEQATGLRAAYLSTALLALANPTTVLPYAAAAPALAGPALAEPAALALLAAGAAAGATGWYLMVGCLATLLPRPLVAGVLPRLNLLAGAAQIGFGLMVYFR